MNNTELRLGNYLAQDPGLNGEDYCVVTKIAPDRVEAKSRTLTSVLYDPEFITLTEEWLVSFGFGMDKKFIFSRSKKPLSVSVDWEWYIMKEDESIGIKIKVPEYVHQLQNLYFALTGQELTVKN